MRTIVCTIFCFTREILVYRSSHSIFLHLNPLSVTPNQPPFEFLSCFLFCSTKCFLFCALPSISAQQNDSHQSYLVQTLCSSFFVLPSCFTFEAIALNFFKAQSPNAGTFGQNHRNIIQHIISTTV